MWHSGPLPKRRTFFGIISVLGYCEIRETASGIRVIGPTHHPIPDLTLELDGRINIIGEQ